MEFEDEHFSASASASSSSSSSSSENLPHNPKTLTPESKPIISQKRKAGRKKFKETRHPIYRGVRQRKGNKWVCEVREPNKKSRIWLGTFPTPEMAARAHDVAAIALRGETAPLNFQDSAWLLKRAKSSSPRDIQMAALAGAMSFGTPEETRTREVMRPSAINVEEEKHVATGTSSSHLNDSSGFSDSSRTMMFVDEEELFNMPGLLDSMAEGLLITPLSMERGFQWGDLNDGDVDLTLWGD